MTILRLLMVLEMYPSINTIFFRTAFDDWGGSEFNKSVEFNGVHIPLSVYVILGF